MLAKNQSLALHDQLHVTLITGACPQTSPCPPFPLSLSYMMETGSLVSVDIGSSWCGLGSAKWCAGKGGELEDREEQGVTLCGCVV